MILKISILLFVFANILTFKVLIKTKIALLCELVKSYFDYLLTYYHVLKKI